MQKISYLCNLCRSEFKNSEENIVSKICGIKFRGGVMRNIELVHPIDAHNHLCTTCMKSLKEVL